MTRSGSNGVADLGPLLRRLVDDYLAERRKNKRLKAGAQAEITESSGCVFYDLGIPCRREGGCPICAAALRAQSTDSQTNGEEL